MTAIAAVRTKTNVVMGADSAGMNTGSYSLYIRRDKKIFRVGPFVIGYTTSFRMGQLLRFGSGDLSLDRLKPAGDGLAFMVRAFVPRMREILKNEGFMTVKDNVERGGQFLVAYGRRLFTIHGDLQVEELHEDYAACGCAEGVIWGSLYSTDGDPHGRVRLALEAAEHHSGGVRRPFVLMET